MTFPHPPLLANGIYHLFTRAVGEEKLFRDSENYLYFLGKLKEHTLPVADFYAYSLMPNHLHLLVKIKSNQELVRQFNEVKESPFDFQKDDISNFVMERFSNCLNTYAKAFNKIYNRKGALFMDYLKRDKIENVEDLKNLICLIHQNVMNHGKANQLGEWPFDSYSTLISNSNTSLDREEVMNIFGGLASFKLRGIKQNVPSSKRPKTTAKMHK